MKYLLIPVFCFASCSMLSPEQSAAMAETGTDIVENLPGAIAGNPVAIGNVVLGVLGGMGILWGGKKVVDKVKASSPGKLTG